MRANDAPSIRGLRGWQRRALVRYLTAKPRDFLLVATPGAGKTAFALRIAAELLADRSVDTLTVVVPTEHLKVQWAQAARRHGLALDPKFNNSNPQTSPEYPGVLVTYASMDPQALWQAGGATALFIAGFGAAGYATRRDLTAIARVSFWALLALIVFGIVLIFVHIPGGALIYSVLGLVIFAGFTMFDFQRIRTSRDIRSAPLLAASIFLDILNVFLLFLRLFGEAR